MTIRRCVPNVVSGDLAASRGFYAGLLGFEVAMDEDDLPVYPDGTVVHVLSLARRPTRARSCAPPSGRTPRRWTPSSSP